uniref:Secreted protein n=1 Tax=Ascaris lumbricoides TaxID=6252 RepID=A0A0M3IHH2_ASCLU
MCVRICITLSLTATFRSSHQCINAITFLCTYDVSIKKFPSHRFDRHKMKIGTVIMDTVFGIREYVQLFSKLMNHMRYHIGSKCRPMFPQ